MRLNVEKLKASAAAVVEVNAGIRVNGKVASLRTQEHSMQFMMETCGRLHRLGYYLEDISGLREKHIEALVKSWYAQAMSNKTMQNQYSRLKIFCTWLGRPGIIDRSGKGVSVYLDGVDPKSLKASVIASASKSWTGNGVDLVHVLKLAEEVDARFGGMLKMGLVFGLRKKEMLRVKLWRADQGSYLEIDGSVAKNGRQRSIWMEPGTAGVFQRAILDDVKRLCKKTETLGWPGLTYKQSENRFYTYAKKIGLTKDVMGVTAHSARAEYMESMALARGLVPPTLGGKADQMKKDDRDKILLDLSKLAGHGRINVVGAYIGSFKRVAQIDGQGGLLGPLVIDGDKDLVAQIYCNPAPVKGPGGTYRKQGAAELGNTSITAVMYEGGEETERMGIHDFFERHEGAAERLQKMLMARGLGGT